MPDDLVFRHKIEEAPPAPETPTAPKELVSDDISGATKATEPSDEPTQPVNALENWETSNGIKYGVELLGLKEVIGEFSFKMQFGTLDKYIREEIGERGWEPNPKHYQDILAELENETGTVDVETYAKLKKISEYIKVVRKYRELKKKKEAFGF